MKIIALIPVWKRPEVLKIHLEHNKEFYTPFYLVSQEDPFLVENTALIESYGHDYAMYSNKHLGEKMNAGINYIHLNYEYDYIMNLGSDDILNEKTYDLYRPYFGGDVIGFSDCHFIDLKIKKALVIENYGLGRAFGGGRLISKEVIEKSRFIMQTIYDNYAMSGLDTNSSRNIQSMGFKEDVIKNDFPVCLDIKTNTNINTFDFIEFSDMSKEVNFKDIYDTFFNS